MSLVGRLWKSTATSTLLKTRQTRGGLLPWTGATQRLKGHSTSGAVCLSGITLPLLKFAPGWGGALYLKTLLWARLTADGVVFKRNRAGWGGGAVAVLGSILQISDARFHDNLALYGSSAHFQKTLLSKLGPFMHACNYTEHHGRCCVCTVFTRCSSFSAGSVL